jgi:hypothetical protein
MGRAAVAGQRTELRASPARSGSSREGRSIRMRHDLTCDAVTRCDAFSGAWSATVRCRPGPRPTGKPCPLDATTAGKTRQTPANVFPRLETAFIASHATFGNAPIQSASSRKRRRFRLLTGGLLVRVQPEEPNPFDSISYERSFSDPSLANDFDLFLPFSATHFDRIPTRFGSRSEGKLIAAIRKLHGASGIYPEGRWPLLAAVPASRRIVAISLLPKPGLLQGAASSPKRTCPGNAPNR